MPNHDIIVIGASAGGIPALMHLCKGLPHDLPAAVFVVVHTSPRSPGMLPKLLDRAGALRAEYARDDAPIRHGTIYVAPPDHHLLLEEKRMRLGHGPRENGFRPAVDPLFRTAARTLGERVIGVILSGGLDDGSEGLLLVKQHGGLAVVQDPIDAPFSQMPQSAIMTVDVDHVVPVAEMAALLVRLTYLPAEHGAPTAAAKRDLEENPVEPALKGLSALVSQTHKGPPSGLTCPECGGALWELQNGKLIKYSCHVGHTYSVHGLLASQDESLESALWTALRALEESAELRRRMAARADRSRFSSVADTFKQQAEEAEARASQLRKLLIGPDALGNGGAHSSGNGGKRSSGNGGAHSSGNGGARSSGNGGAHRGSKAAARSKRRPKRAARST
ncbi:MAG TPA: chemotaxis protein CheB [Humisphaera sp.]|jgi:two-component system chemotaxis response regulator CheB|nr:chemotaxis protein CheB [Humisphaera sp.]